MKILLIALFFSIALGSFHPSSQASENTEARSIELTKYCSTDYSQGDRILVRGYFFPVKGMSSKPGRLYVDKQSALDPSSSTCSTLVFPANEESPVNHCNYLGLVEVDGFVEQDFEKKYIVADRISYIVLLDGEESLDDCHVTPDVEWRNDEHN